MLRLGDYNTLRIKKRTEYGLYLDGGDEGNILLPNRYVTRDMHIGDELEVFIYLDQDERTIATTEHPIAKVGEFAYLECAWTIKKPSAICIADGLSSFPKKVFSWSVDARLRLIVISREEGDEVSLFVEGVGRGGEECQEEEDETDA